MCKLSQVVRSRMVLHLAVALVACLGAASMSFATAPTIPDVGVDFPGLVTAAGTALGTTVVAIVGVYFGFLIVRLAMKWSKKIA